MNVLALVVKVATRLAAEEHVYMYIYIYIENQEVRNNRRYKKNKTGIVKHDV